MKTKLIGIFICMLLIGTVLPVTGTQRNSDFKLSDRKLTNNSGWTEKQKLLASDGYGVTSFGYSISIDGDTALIGSEFDDDNGDGSGSVYVFTRNGNTWTEQSKLLPSDGEEDDRFGCSVSLDGDIALIGAWLDDDNGYNSGAAYVFTRNGNTWTEQAKLLPSDGTVENYFGLPVSIDGDTALIGSWGDDYYGNSSGSAYVFTRNGNTWTEQAKLLPADGEERDYFGWRVSIDGDTALFGVPWEDDKGRNSGAAYVFTRNGDTWTEQLKILPTDIETLDNFGCSVSIDGDTALIGAENDDDNGGNSGSAYVFTRNGNTWTEQAKLLSSDAVSHGWFGCSVSLDGDTALIGAYHDDDNGDDSGSAYVFTRNGDTWTEQSKLLPADGEEGDRFGLPVSIDGMYAIVGAITDYNIETGAGSVYVFIENEKPIIPNISGPTKVIPEIIYDYNFTNCIDPEGANMTYHVEWGDGDVDKGFVESGGAFNLSHNWTEKGYFIIRAKLIDDYELESDWATLEISVQRTRTHWLRFIDIFPILQKILCYIL